MDAVWASELFPEGTQLIQNVKYESFNQPGVQMLHLANAIIIR